MRWSDVTSPTRRQLREFGVILGVVLTTLAVVATLWPLALPGAAALLLGVFAPTALKPLWVVWTAAVFPAAFLVSNLILGALFFLMIAPLALWFRLIGRDALDRRLQPGQDSYWEDRPADGDPKRYLRQY